MAEPPQASEALYRTVQQYQLLLLAALRSLWAGMLPGNFDASWRRIGPQMVAITAGAQLAAAIAATAYVPAVLEETGQPDEPLARVRPQAFAGVASDGRNLASLLEGSVRLSKLYVDRGLDGGDALAQGEKFLERAARTVAADAARDAVQAEIAVRKRMGYVRLINPPCCSRCAVLAGKWYRHNEIMPRHDNCDCQLIPASENVAGDFLTDPQALYKRGLINDLTKGQRGRLDDGADLVRVLNESRDRWRQRLAEQRKATGPVDRLGRSRPQGWPGGGTTPPPVGTTIVQLFDKLTADVDRNRIADAMRSAGIAG